MKELVDSLWTIFRRYPRNLAVFVCVYHLVGAAFKVGMPLTQLKQFATDLGRTVVRSSSWPIKEIWGEDGRDVLSGLDSETTRALWKAKLPAGEAINVFATLLLKLRSHGASLEHILDTLSTEWDLTAKGKT